MQVPQDIANLLAVAIRDLIWYRAKVVRFLEQCGVQPAVMIEVRRMAAANTPTMKVVPFVLEELSERGSDGAQALRTMLTKIYYWNDLHTVDADRKDKAVASLKAFRQAYDRYRLQRE